MLVTGVGPQAGVFPISTHVFSHLSGYLHFTRGETETQRQEATLSRVSHLGTSKAETLGRRVPAVLVEALAKSFNLD